MQNDPLRLTYFKQQQQQWLPFLGPKSNVYYYSEQGPVVQSIVSLTSSLRVISLTVLADSVYNILTFFAEKMWVAFFSKKLQHICVSLDVNFNESLTNDVVSFEQLGPVFYFFGILGYINSWLSW